MEEFQDYCINSKPVYWYQKQDYVLAPTSFNTCMDWILYRIVIQNLCRATLCNIKAINFAFAEDVAFLSKSLEILQGVLLAFTIEAKTLGLEVSWNMTKSRILGVC